MCQQAVEIERPSRFWPGAGQSFAAKRLDADDRAHHITVNVQVADMGGTGDLRNGFINTGMYAQR